MPEDFYTWTCLPVVTPDNAAQWTEHILKNFVDHSQLHFQEYMSGSSRMTLCGTLMSLLVAFTVDHRCGWDLNDRKHQRIIDDIAEKLKIYMSWFSPRCSPWSKANRKNQAAKAKARLEEQAALSWITSKCRSILDTAAYKTGEPSAEVLETPHGFPK